jgi:hypothetical protein
MMDFDVAFKDPDQSLIFADDSPHQPDGFFGVAKHDAMLNYY